MPRTTSLLLPAVLVLFFGPSRVHAGLMIITSGVTIKPVGDVIETKRQEAREKPRGMAMRSPSVGFGYNHFSLFWLEFWTWNGSYCLYEGPNVVRIAPETAADLLGLDAQQLEPPFRYRYPPGLLFLGGFLLLSVPLRMLGRRHAGKMQALLSDPRYQHALEVFRRGARSEAAFEEAVLSLEREGIPREEAVRKLRTLLAQVEPF